MEYTFSIGRRFHEWRRPTRLDLLCRHGDVRLCVLGVEPGQLPGYILSLLRAEMLSQLEQRECRPIDDAPQELATDAGRRGRWLLTYE